MDHARVRVSGDARVRNGDGPHEVRAHSRSGMTLLELMVAFSILFLAVLGFTKVIVFSSTTTGGQREVSIAREAARQTIEMLQAENFEDIFALYNDNPLDDPGGATAPGSTIDVPELNSPTDAPGPVGRISFPTIEDAVAGLQLREDVQNATLGMPRDLNGDGAVDSLDHADDYALLPVVIRFEWEGKGGRSNLEIKTLLADY